MLHVFCFNLIISNVRSHGRNGACHRCNVRFQRDRGPTHGGKKAIQRTFLLTFEIEQREAYSLFSLDYTTNCCWHFTCWSGLLVFQCGRCCFNDFHTEILVGLLLGRHFFFFFFARPRSWCPAPLCTVQQGHQAASPSPCIAVSYQCKNVWESHNLVVIWKCIVDAAAATIPYSIYHPYDESASRLNHLPSKRMLEAGVFPLDMRFDLVVEPFPERSLAWICELGNLPLYGLRDLCPLYLNNTHPYMKGTPKYGSEAVCPFVFFLASLTEKACRRLISPWTALCHLGRKTRHFLCWSFIWCGNNSYVLGISHDDEKREGRINDCTKLKRVKVKPTNVPHSFLSDSSFGRSIWSRSRPAQCPALSVSLAFWRTVDEPPYTVSQESESGLILCIWVSPRVHNPKSVQLPTQPLCSAATAELHITWHGSKGYSGKQCKVTTRELYPKLGCEQPCIYHAQSANNVCGFISWCEVLPSQTP